MNEIIKQNWFKMIIAIAVLIIACSIGYYFVIFLPNFHNKETIIQNQTTCSQTEQKVISKNYPNIIPGITSVTSNSHYNSNLQKCFVNVKTSSENDPGHSTVFGTEDGVFDALENKVLLLCVSTHHSDSSVDSSCWDHRVNETGTEIPRATFDSLKNSYMNQ